MENDWIDELQKDARMKIVSSDKDKVKVTFGIFAQYLYMRMLIGSSTHGGKLRFDDDMPFTPERLAWCYGLDERKVKRALKVMEKYGLVKWDDNQSIVMLRANEYDWLKLSSKTRIVARRNTLKHDETH